MLYLITKLQNLKAIHNSQKRESLSLTVVSNYKITKSESYSQLTSEEFRVTDGCI